MKDPLPIFKDLLQLNLDQELKQSNYKQLYIQCKRNVKQFIDLVQRQMETILKNHRQQKQILKDEISLLKSQLHKSNSQVSLRRISENSVNQNSMTNTLSKEKVKHNLNKQNLTVKSNVNSTNNSISFSIDNLLQKTMNRSIHMKELQKMFGGESKISKIQSIKSSVLQQKIENNNCRRYNSNSVPKQIQGQIMANYTNNTYLKDGQSLKNRQSLKDCTRLKDSTRLKDKAKSKQNNIVKHNNGAINNLLLNMRQTMNDKIKNQSNLEYKSISKYCPSIVQSPYFGSKSPKK